MVLSELTQRVDGQLRRLRKLIPLARPQAGRMCVPGSSRHYEALAVADVDLDTGSVTPRAPATPFVREPEGVHAVAWYHGEPVGELTVPGSADVVLPSLVALAGRELAGALREHRIRDSLATPGAMERGDPLDPPELAHPPGTQSDASGVTVAVCTRDRAEDLRRCLQALADLREQVAEILVVDNASRDGRTQAVAAEFPAVRYVWEPRQGLDWARNRALLEARTPVVAFTDDDVEVHPGWVGGILRAFSEEPSAVVVTGLVIPAELATPAQVLFEAEGGFGRGYRRVYFAAAVEQGEVAARRHAGIGRAGTGANMAVHRETALRLGGFDPALDVGTPTGGGGDLEFFFRIVAAGHLVVYEPSAVVRHRHRPTMEGFLRQRRGDGTGSYSWFLGAGRRYGKVQFRGFCRFAAWWIYRMHVRHTVRSLLWPRLWPPPIVRAEAAGAIAAIVGRLYARAVRQAAEQAALHPGEPTVPDLVHTPTPARRRAEPTPPPLREIDLAENPLVDGLVPERDSSAATNVTVRVMHDHAVLATFTSRSAGVGLSTARLRIETAARLAASWPEPEPADHDGQPKVAGTTCAMEGRR